MQLQSGHDRVQESSMVPYYCLLSAEEKVLLKEFTKPIRQDLLCYISKLPEIASALTVHKQIRLTAFYEKKYFLTFLFQNTAQQPPTTKLPVVTC